VTAWRKEDLRDWMSSRVAKPSFDGIERRNRD
jgi:hypothetical protein